MTIEPNRPTSSSPSASAPVAPAVSEPRTPQAVPPSKGEALDALRERTLPTGVLEGLYDQVAACLADSSPEARWARAAMSGAFLDAPRSLVVWRRVALAASLLLAVGLGTWVQGPGAPSGAGGRALEPVDPRDALLALDRPDADAATAPGGPAVPVSHGGMLPTRGAQPARAPVFIWMGRSSGDAAAQLDRLPPLAPPQPKKEELRERN